ncbi:MAG: ABC transporter ATP-binding protein [Veillonellaceae bacterium]|nr:ABC transporter ATP-binding protein [Veillonellaceae bacterium]
MAFLEVKSLTKRFGGLVAVNDVSFSVEENQIIGLIGPNGAGKSTFFATIAGYYKPDSGSIEFSGEQIGGLLPETIAHKGITRTFQIVRPFGTLSVLENVMVGAFLRTKNQKKARGKAEEILEFTGLAQKRDLVGSALTIADKKRLELARALATEPRLLLLDEVMAGLTPKETFEAVELVKKINQRGITLFIVEHVMEVVMPISQQIFVLDGGKLISSGPPTVVSKDPAVIKAYLGERYYAEHQGA